MKHLDLILLLLCLFFWGALYVVYYKDRLFPWLINRFTRDRRPKNMKIDNGYFPDGTPIPFRENLYPSPKREEDETAGTDASPPEKHPSSPSEKPSGEEGKSDHGH